MTTKRRTGEVGRGRRRRRQRRDDRRRDDERAMSRARDNTSRLDEGVN